MKRFFMFFMLGLMLNVFCVFANVYDYSQLSQAKLVNEYSNDTFVDQMDTVVFGSYPQSAVSGSVKEPIEWLVLDRRNGMALLLSKYILFANRFDSTYSDYWASCSLRYQLNNPYYDLAWLYAFTDLEKNLIVESEIDNNFNENNSRDAGKATKDKFFLLSYEEVKNYFGVDANKECIKLATRGTDYAKYNVNHPLWVCDLDAWNNGNSYWWLRSSAGKRNTIWTVSSNGIYDGRTYGSDFRDETIGVRPAMWVRID